MLRKRQGCIIFLPPGGKLRAGSKQLLSGGLEIAIFTSSGFFRIDFARFWILGGMVAENMTTWHVGGNSL